MQDTYIGDEGKGFPLVLVHGFLGSSKMWEPQIDFFKDYFRVITPDLPGYGKSNKAKSRNSIQSTANLLLDCLKEKKIDKIDKVHNYLDNLDGIGKVLSFSSILKVAEQLNNNKELGTLEMGVLYSKIPDSIKKEIVDPYISIEHNEARINLRIKDSQEGLRRNELIKKIQYDLENKLNLKKDEFKFNHNSSKSLLINNEISVP